MATRHISTLSSDDPPVLIFGELGNDLFALTSKTHTDVADFPMLTTVRPGSDVQEWRNPYFLEALRLQTVQQCTISIREGNVFRSIFVVEDDVKMARMVKVYLESAGFCVKHFDHGRDAIEAAGKEAPLLLILDLMLPDIPGEEVLMKVKEYGDFPVIMLTSRASEEERLAGFALGADDYVVKPFSPRELVFRVKSVLKRSEMRDLSSAELMSFEDGSLLIDGQRYEAKRQGQVLHLTPTEFKILYTLASHPGKTFSRKELAEEALGYQFDGYERSIDAHIRHIRQKIEDDPGEPNLILTIYGVGYRFSGKRDA